MKVLILAVCVAVCSAWTPGARDVCNPTNVVGGTQLLPHERYCQLFYMCSEQGRQQEQFCSATTLFAYGIGTATCAITGTAYICPKWPCAQPSDVGRRYPDLCCGKYWECTSIGNYQQRNCQAGTTFDMTSEQCSSLNTCVNDAFCVDVIQTNPGQTACYNSPSTNGDPCSYQSLGWTGNRPCPYGTSYNPNTCGCTTYNDACKFTTLTAAQKMQNKEGDASCRASGRMDFTNAAFLVFSDKLNSNIDHYIYNAGGVTANGIELVYNNNNNAFSPFLYDYYYNDLTLHAPLAIIMTVRLDETLNTGVSLPLLENRWTTDANNDHCNPVSLGFYVRYTGFNNIQQVRNWEFTVSAIGENGVQSTAVGSISGVAQDYFRIVFQFTGTISASVLNGGPGANEYNANDPNRTTRLDGDNRPLGGSLRPNKCGFAIGRGLQGRIREFNVHEGCGNFNNLGR